MAEQAQKIKHVSAGKVFWDSQGISLNMLNHFKEELKQKQSRLAHRKVLFYQDRVPSHKSTIIDKIA